MAMALFVSAPRADYGQDGLPFFEGFELNQTAYVSNTLTFMVRADDTDHEWITLSASNLPANAVFDEASGPGPVAQSFQFTPDVSQAGTNFSILFVATDSQGTHQQAVNVQVLDRVLTLSPEKIRVSEDGLSGNFTVRLSRPLDAVIRFAVDGEAVRDEDLALIPDELVFTPDGPAEQAVLVIARDDDLPEGPEVSLLRVTNDDVMVESAPVELRVLDDDVFTIVAANLTSGNDQFYEEPGIRILESLQPDIVAIQEFNVHYPGRHREFVDRHFGTNFHFFVEPDAERWPIPNGVISRWPIKAAGIWDDPQLSNRDFVWATIDVPGGRDLHVISVHFHASGGASSRAIEARALTNYVARANFHPNDLVIIAGDLNTGSRTEAAFLILTNVFSDKHQAVDQAGVTGTSSSRSLPLDHILPGYYLDSRHLPVRFGGLIFPDGLVFDTRIWANPAPPAPALPTDSGVSGMQHMGVMKWFALDREVTVLARHKRGGRVIPDEVELPIESNQTFQIVADPYFFITGVSNLAIEGVPSSWTYDWTNAQANGWLDVAFAPHMTTDRIPHWWLAGYGVTNITEDFNGGIDGDGDGFSFLQEYVAGTDPTDPESGLILATPAPDEAGFDSFVMHWPSAADRLYNLWMSTNLTLADGFVPWVTNIAATPPLNVYTARLDQAPAIFEGFEYIDLAANWQLEGISYYSSFATSGASGPPSARFDDSTDRITVSGISDPTGLSFMLLGQSSDVSNRFVVEVYAGGEWAEIDRIMPVNGTKLYKNYDLQTNATHIRFTYNKTGVGNVALDDVQINLKGTSEPTAPVFLLEAGLVEE